jgi:hypothetical protein
VLQFASTMRGKVNTLNLWGCEIAWRNYDQPGHLMYELANRLHAANGPAVTVGAYDQSISYSPPWQEDNGRFRPAYQAVDQDAVWRTVTAP